MRHMIESVKFLLIITLVVTGCATTSTVTKDRYVEGVYFITVYDQDSLHSQSLRQKLIGMGLHKCNEANWPYMALGEIAHTYNETFVDGLMAAAVCFRSKERWSLGVRTKQSHFESLPARGIPDNGDAVEVVEVIRTHKSTLRNGDILFKVNEHRVELMSDVLAILRDSTKHTAMVEFYRAGKVQRAEIFLIKRDIESTLDEMKDDTDENSIVASTFLQIYQ